METTNIIKDSLKEELDRNRRAQHAYLAEHSQLPRGSVTNRKRGDRTYTYLKYREGDKVRTDYVGIAEQVESEIREQVDQRKELEAAIQRLKHEERFIKKALRHS